MPRDLFAASLRSRSAQPRSVWTIIGSVLAHAGLVVALLVLPILSALDDYVVHATNSMVVSIPATAVPDVPPAPPSSASPAVSDINPAAAPTRPPVNPVVGVGTPPATFGARVGDLFAPGGIGTGPGVFQGPVSQSLAPPPPAPVVPVRPGGDIKPPVRTTYVAPQYPAIAKAAKIGGTVILEAIIDETGRVRDVRVLRSIPLLDAAAVAAVSQWRYAPTQLNGTPVPVILTVTVMFSLK
jgi:protein TonB